MVISREGEELCSRPVSFVDLSHDLGKHTCYNSPSYFLQVEEKNGCPAHIIPTVMFKW